MIANAMRLLTLIVLAGVPIAAMGAPHPKAPPKAIKQFVLAPTDYGAAEAIFRRFLSDTKPTDADTNDVRFISCGSDHSDLPVDFLARFRSNSVVVMNGSASEIRAVRREGRIERVVAERKGKREGLGIALCSLTIAKDSAEATVMTVSAGITTVSWTVKLKWDGASWRVTEKIQGFIACFG